MIPKALAPMDEIATWALVKVHTQRMGGLRFERLLLRKLTDEEGDALWVTTPSAPMRMGLAFPWRLMAPGILVVADQLAITTNALFTDDSGIVAPSLQIVYCASLLYTLPWQADVFGAI